ncbi:MAG: hypothetical protein FJ316_12355 [SAR202 cluster bacterium]|nr:hypothetical protein [SAR202 cluster bacterium]
MRIRLVGKRIIPKILGSPAGFTLVEAAVGIAILTMGVTMVGNGIFRTLDVQRFWQDDVVATKDLRHAGSYFAGDALIAEGTDLVDGASPVQSVTLTWSDKEGAPHWVTYALDGTTLMRNLDGVQLPIAPGVVSVAFSRTGNVVDFSLEVEAERGGTETVQLSTFLRKMS